MGEDLEAFLVLLPTASFLILNSGAARTGRCLLRVSLTRALSRLMVFSVFPSCVASPTLNAAVLPHSQLSWTRPDFQVGTERERQRPAGPDHRAAGSPQGLVF